MNKLDIIHQFGAGFTVGDSQYPDNLFVDRANTKDNELWLLAYDANMTAAPNFETWDSDYQKQVIDQLRNDERLENTNLSVYIDGKRVIRGIQVNY